MRTFRLALAGYGAVGRALVALLATTTTELAGRRDLRIVVTLVASRRLGVHVDGSGFDTGAVVDDPGGRGRGRGRVDVPLPDVLADPATPYDVLVEITSQSPRDGEPAATHIRAALRSGRDVVTANKGPIAWRGAELAEIAAASGARLRYEATLMDNLPTHALRERIVPVGRIVGFEGIVNATTNSILDAMAAGRPATEALAEAQRSGLAETDPRNDLEGHDAALKATILANLLLDPAVPVTPDAVARQGIDGIPDAWPREAAGRGARVRLVVRAEGAGEGTGRTVSVSVAPEELPASDSLALVAGTSMALRVHSEYGGTLQLALLDGTVAETAYAILMDLVALAG